MSRIAGKFEDLHKRKEKALIVYLTAGDPSLPATKKLIPVLEDAGADILEIGVPFSDPTADGPVIQAAAQRALKKGAALAGILQLIRELRKSSEIPVVLFGYFNPILAYGIEKFANDAHKAGIDGILVVDLPPEEAWEIRRYTDRLGIDFISLVAPTTDEARIRRIAASAGGFLYYISVTGITGTAAPESGTIRKELEKIRRITDLPLAVGFGISTAKQAKEIGRFADGVVIGSAVVKMVDENRSKTGLLKTVSSYIKSVKQGLCQSNLD